MPILNLNKQKDRNQYAESTAEKLKRENNIKKTFKIAITISEFGNLAKFYKTYAKGNREIIVEQIEFEGSPDQHNTGLMTDIIVCKRENLIAEVKKFIAKTFLWGESFNITEEGKKKVIMTEVDLPK